MKANELRIGNYFLSYGVDLKQIERLNKDKIIIDFHPIPLTEEWLVKFGFLLQTDDSDEPDNLCKTFWSIPNHDEFNYDSETKEFIHCGMGLVKITHIHQLQNLYFALTGEELCLEK